MPSIGEMAPSSTWYRPRYSWVRSTATMSRGSSTTHSSAESRRSSRQYTHSSPSAKLKHRRHQLTRSFASTIARARRLASSGALFSRKNAMRCADLGPMPGSRPSSSTRVCTGPSKGDATFASAERAAETRAETAEIEPAGDIAHPLGLELLRASHRLADRRDHEVFEHLDVVGVDHVARDPHRLNVAGARHDCGHLPATGGSFDEGGRQLILRRGHVGLHLLHLAHHLVELLLVRHDRPTPACSARRAQPAPSGFTRGDVLRRRWRPTTR